MTNVPPIPHRKRFEQSSDKIMPSNSIQVFNKVEDFNNIVVMRGTATRKSLEKKEKHSDVRLIQKNYLKENFLKLRAPFYKSRSKQSQSEEKLMTKSCEILLGCIKPYKDIRMPEKTKVTESVTIGSILKTTSIIYERKATRKVQFFSFAEENPTSFMFNTQSPSMRLFKTATEESDYDNPEDDMKCSNFDEFQQKEFHSSTKLYLSGAIILYCSLSFGLLYFSASYRATMEEVRRLSPLTFLTLEKINFDEVIVAFGSSKIETSPSHAIKTISSEDFITKVIPGPGTAT